jgi:hypothetical protein
MRNDHGAHTRLEQTEQLRHSVSSSSQVNFESSQVCGYNGGAGRVVRRGTQLPDLIQRHLQLTKPGLNRHPYFLSLQVRLPPRPAMATKRS